MLVKWITCQVSPESHGAFSIAQSEWARMSGLLGFLGQIGGWDEAKRDVACVMSLWRDQQSYSAFMRDHHDSIISSNHQSDSYKSITVDFFEPRFPMPGKYINLVGALTDGNHLRVADCLVKQGRAEHFEEVQKRVWIPAMAHSSGMLGGSFNISKKHDNRYLVTTLWESHEQHRNYSTDHVPRLRKEAELSDDLYSFSGWSVRLERSWFVPAS